MWFTENKIYSNNKMPRQVIPESLKRMKTFNVHITETTEIQLWNHIQSKIEEYEKNSTFLNNLQDEMVSRVRDENPYYGKSFRKPLDRLIFDDWLDEKYTAILVSVSNFRQDVFLCNQAFNWSEEHPEFNDLLHLIEKKTYNFQSEFIHFEKVRFQQAKKDWEIKDAVWVAEHKLKRDHESHRSKSYWVEEFKTMSADQIERWFPKGIPDNEETCKYCIQAKSDVKERAELEIKFETEVKENELHQKEQKRLQQEQNRMKHIEKREAELANRVLQKCEVCNFETYNAELFDFHMDSKEHIRLCAFKKSYCNDCKLQCRTMIEYGYHITTTKHKVNCGEIKKVTEFKCEACNYSTHLKQSYEKHLESKAHKDKTTPDSGETLQSQ